MSWDEQAFKEKLENSHTFPGSYIFKFIIKSNQQEQVKSLVDGAEIRLKPSSRNKYLSITIQKTMASSQEVVDVYNKAFKIEGIISL